MQLFFMSKAEDKCEGPSRKDHDRLRKTILTFSIIVETTTCCSFEPTLAESCPQLFCAFSAGTMTRPRSSSTPLSTPPSLASNIPKLTSLAIFDVDIALAVVRTKK